jgi:hypothetical protein
VAPQDRSSRVVLESVSELVADLIVHRPRHADPTGLGKRFQPRRDVHAVAEDVVLLGDYIAEVNPDTELDPLLRRDSRIGLCHSPLHLNRAPDDGNHASVATG